MQLVNPKTLYNNNPFAVHIDRVNYYSPTVSWLLPISPLPARPNLPEDPPIPYNGFTTAEDGEKASSHLLRKANVDANWIWVQTMRATTTSPLYKALNTLAEKNAV